MSDTALINLASDNWSPAHPQVMEALNRANVGTSPAYGNDPYTAEAADVIRKQIGADVEPFFVFTGTAANVLSLDSCIRPYDTVICSGTAHVYTSEWGAAERITGSRLLPIETPSGKISAKAIAERIEGMPGHFGARPRVVSITQATEYGTVYSIEETKAIARVVHDAGLLLHMDGARISNAAVSLGTSLKEATADCGVDVLSLGGTKNGALFAEAVVFINPALAHDFPMRRQQTLQLSSKHRYIAVQFTALFGDDLWKRNASHANTMARRLSDGFATIGGVRVTQPTDANEVFAILPAAVSAALREIAAFHVWDKRTGELRFVCAFDTREEDIDTVIGRAQEVSKAM